MLDDRLREYLAATFCIAILVGVAFFSAYGGMSRAQQAQDRPLTDTASYTGQETAHEEGTEFWPPFFGYRLKVTDTLVVAFTAGLFLSTLALWQATRRLVVGAENTSERQLRAYVLTEGVSLWTTEKPDGVRIVLPVKFKNFGQTPAYNFGSWSDAKISAQNPGFTVKQSRIRNTLIGPGDVTNIRPDEGPFSQEDIDAVLTGEKFIFACVRIDYVDAFGIDRTTTFYFRNGNRLPGARDEWEVENTGPPEKTQ